MKICKILFVPAILTLIILLCGLPVLALGEAGENSDIENSEDGGLAQGELPAKAKKKKKKKKKKEKPVEENSKDSRGKAPKQPIDWRLKALCEKVNLNNIAQEWGMDEINGKQIIYIAQTIIDTAEDLLKIRDDQTVEFEHYRSAVNYSTEQLDLLENRLVTRHHWFSYQHATVWRFLPYQLREVSAMIKLINGDSSGARKIKEARIRILLSFKDAAHLLENLANEVQNKTSHVRKYFAQPKYKTLEAQVQIEMNEIELGSDERPMLTYDQKFRAAALVDMLNQTDLLREKQEKEARAILRQIEEKKEIEKQLKRDEIAIRVAAERKKKALQALVVDQGLLAKKEAAEQKARWKEEIEREQDLAQKREFRGRRLNQANDLLRMIADEDAARKAEVLFRPNATPIPYDPQALMQPLAWKIEKTSEYIEAYTSLEDDEKRALDEVVELLQQSGPELRLPHATPVKNCDDIYELRPNCVAHTTLRPLYAWVNGRAVLLTIAPEAERNPTLFKTRVKQAEAILAEIH